MENQTAGHGKQSHEVPTAENLGVLMLDGKHDGTLVTWVPNREVYVFASLDGMGCSTARRCALVHLGCVLADNEHLLSGVYGCDLEAGLVLIGLDIEEQIPAELGTVLWDSAA